MAKKPHVTHVAARIPYGSKSGDIEYKEEDMTLAQMQEYVGGYIEMVPTTLAHRSLIVNEEGLIRELPINMAATELVRPGTLILDGIHGNALLVKS